MKHVCIILLAGVLFYSCGKKGSRDKETQIENQTETAVTTEDQQSTEIMLKEDFISSIAIPIHGSNLTPFLEKCFTGYNVAPEWLTAEGGDFLSYEIKYGEKTSGSIAMSMDDSTKLYEILVYDSTWVDQYGVRVGNKMEDVWLKRMNLNVKMGYHFHVYAQAPGSNIFYEIAGEYDGPDDVMMERINNAKSDQSFLNNWKVVHMIWSKHSLI